MSIKYQRGENASRSSSLFNHHSRDEVSSVSERFERNASALKFFFEKRDPINPISSKMNAKVAYARA